MYHHVFLVLYFYPVENDIPYQTNKKSLWQLQGMFHSNVSAQITKLWNDNRNKNKQISLAYCKHVLEIVGEWVMNRQPFWIKIFHISPILLGRFCDKKVWKLLSVLCSLWEIFGRENLQCVFSLQTLQCAMFLFSYNLA